MQILQTRIEDFTLVTLIVEPLIKKLPIRIIFDPFVGIVGRKFHLMTFALYKGREKVEIFHEFM